ncbi:MAG TPA: 6,7-dimethyl-8-ribityllumazine synthase [Candidatus Dormibacteraeota bacterium]|nr:6,7-dimethyl-8-ribityllumazine synthase [Candidatus Dormibacteraeota bacterium]
MKAESHLLGSDLSIAILVARENDDVTKRLLRGAEDMLKSRGVEGVETYWVPSALDLPLVALALAEKGGPDAIVALGAVIDDDIAAMQATSGLMQAQLDTGVPIAFGVLATEDVDQALARSGPKNNKGAEAAEAAIEMANLLREIQG